ncbi:hypothetical protein K2173_014886 [Erythroxylum novogranatense]|uniref:Uncharacterized protein n=1 Tax=Erythroxylum novogranatense TaxID=1862640 RepID=A0AAV8TIE9_9ROSI|nr:hypothetical protein K2173_014886 [Erythroxylum novogranatense]
MGPELELKEKWEVTMETLASKENGHGPKDPVEKDTESTINHEEKTSHADIQEGHSNLTVEDEGMFIDILDCRGSIDKGLVESRCEDANESMSSFGDTTSESDNNPILSGTEVESGQSIGDRPASVFDDYGGLFPVRRKKLTDHWRRFIRPLMWRLKWIELQIKEFKSQAQKYDKELTEHEQKKHYDFGTFMMEGCDAKSLPFLSCARRKVMKRRKRKRFEETTDIGSYMLQHNLFSYYENKKSATISTALDDEHINTDKTVSGNDDFGFQYEWQSILSRDSDDITEHVLQKIEMLQSKVQKLKARIEKVISENPGKFASVNRLSLPAPFNAFDSPDQGHVSNPTNGDRMLLRSVAEGSMEDIAHESVVSSCAKGTHLPNTIKSARPQEVVLCGNMEDGILIHNQAAKEEIQDLKNIGSWLPETHEKLQEPQAVEDSKTVIPTETIVDRVNYGGKTLPKPRTNALSKRRKRGRRKSGAGRWSRRS